MVGSLRIGNVKFCELFEFIVLHVSRVVADFFGAYDCTRIVGNIDFCVSVKSRYARQMAFLPEETLYWVEAQNHPTDIHRMLAQLVLTIKGETTHMDFLPPRSIMVS